MGLKGRDMVFPVLNDICFELVMGFLMLWINGLQGKLVWGYNKTIENKGRLKVSSLSI